MCGIVGYLQLGDVLPNSAVNHSVNHLLSHRGPDAVGCLAWSPGVSIYYSKDWETLPNLQLFFLHRRLSILDLSISGWQPMGTEDGRYAIIFNGEIYNYLELQAELIKLGYVFSSHSDTEVLLNAYAAWGIAALTKLVGMFAFAILDTQRQSLFLARDCFGIKPLYYTLNEHYFAFASEISALLTIPGVSHKANSELVYSYLHSNHTDCNSSTFFKDIQQLLPAHYLEITIGNPEIAQPKRYWDIALDNRLDISFKEATKQLQQLFLNNIQLHLRSDVPVGAALSGGLDSSAIVMAMRHLQGSSLSLHTFSYVASQPTLCEEKWVDLITSSANTIVHKVRLAPTDLVHDLESLIRAQGEPFGSTTIYAQYRVFQLAKSAGIKVMLDGQGADELLGGYRPYLAARLASLVVQGNYGKAYSFLQKSSRFSGVSSKFLLARMGGLLLPEQLQTWARFLARRQRIQPWMNADWVNGHDVAPMALRLNQQRDVLQEQLYRALTQVSVPMLLRYEDRNSMAHSIESRVPFLTPALAEFLLALPEDYLIGPDGTSKYIFREAMRGIVPDEVLDRRDKIGFATPERVWMVQMQGWVKQLLSSDTARRIPVFELERMQTLFDSMLAGKTAFDGCVWRWINLICWAECFDVVFED